MDNFYKQGRGVWSPAPEVASSSVEGTNSAQADPVQALRQLSQPVFVIAKPSQWQKQSLPFTLVNHGQVRFPAQPARPTSGTVASDTTSGTNSNTANLCGPTAPNSSSTQNYPLLAMAPPVTPSTLGETDFRNTYGLKYACLSGSMANGIASEELVCSMAKAGMMGFFGSAGLSLEEVRQHIDSLQAKLEQPANSGVPVNQGRPQTAPAVLPHGFNLIHSPSDPQLEEKLVQLFIAKNVQNIEASAFLGLTPALLHYRYSGLKRNSDGTVYAPHHVFAKISRLEVAQKLLAPPPEDMLRNLVEAGKLTPQEAELAQGLPAASALTAEADSGGHTDNRPALGLIPAVINLRDRMREKYGWYVPVGAAGGIATPQAAAAAFAMGAAYVMTGSINQACQESGTCDVVRGMLAHATPADVMMAPAADMFEMGVNVQVLKWGTMFPVRARKLYEIYRTYPSFEQVPPNLQSQIERDFLRTSFQEAWQSTQAFFQKRDPRQIEKALRDPKHLMALVFRSYLGQASRWANAGVPERRADYQIWCGPAMGSFNQWCKGTFLADVKERHADLAALNIMAGAGYLTRTALIGSQGVKLPPQWCSFAPLPYQEIASLLQESSSVF
ncbi:MAG: PfaD family polyunsaturated fatty acid/polyketide biosynthesis protein [bacterium]|nr:PfaD family polyunsaturated fatty acid/polyketide biosynthesis protein [bacterium]